MLEMKGQVLDCRDQAALLILDTAFNVVLLKHKLQLTILTIDDLKRRNMSV